MTISKLLYKSCQKISYWKNGLFQADFNTVNKVICETQKYKQFIPWCTQSKITKKISENENYTNLRISFNKFKNLDYLSHVTVETNENQTKVKSVCKDYPLKYLQSVWKIQKQNDFQTKIIYTIDFQFSSVFFQLTSSLFMNYMGQQMWNIFHSESESRFSENKKVKNQKNFENILHINTECINYINKRPILPKNKKAIFYPILNEEMSSQLIKFLQKYPQFKLRYQKDSMFKAKADELYFKLKKTQKMQEKLSFQLKNLLSYYQ